ncbi:uDENN domain-containing protein [Chytriomyces sp. MP71]|nr:uDENN domain-containing protein [Chytriomyces sp. MP71]
MKRKHPLEYKYEIATVHRYPESDHSEKERLPDGLAMFCFPNGLQFKHSPDTSLECTTHSFVITEETGAKLYGVCLLLYEPIQEPLASQLEELLEEWRADCVAGTDVEYLQHIQSQLAANQEQILRIRSGMVEGLSGAEMEDILSDAEEKVALFRERLKEMEHVAGVDMENVYVPRCVGVISRWAFYDLFADWLKVVVRMVKDTAIEDGDASAKGLLVNFMDEIPLPPPGRVEVKLTIGRYNLFCSRPPVNSIQALQNVRS